MSDLFTQFIFPSDADRAENEDLDRVCVALETYMEDYPALVERAKAAEAEVEWYRKIVAGECLRLKAGDVLVVKLAAQWVADSGVAGYEHYRDGLRSVLPAGVQAIFLAEGIDLQALDEEAMRRAGWVRAEVDHG